MLRQDASYASDGDSVTDVYYPALYPDVVPNNLPYDAYDNSWLVFRDSFHWTPRQTIGLPGILTNFTAADYLRARMRHWLHERPWTPTAGYVSQTLDMETEPSPDGLARGLVIWYNYAGKWAGD